jgi:hypothetical protein
LTVRGALVLLALALAVRSSAPSHCIPCANRDPAARAAFMRASPCPANGKTRGPCPGFVVDHVVALKRGGRDSPDNMQWQTVEEARAKDRYE